MTSLPRIVVKIAIANSVAMSSSNQVHYSWLYLRFGAPVVTIVYGSDWINVVVVTTEALRATGNLWLFEFMLDLHGTAHS